MHPSQIVVWQAATFIKDSFIYAHLKLPRINTAHWLVQIYTGKTKMQTQKRHIFIWCWKTDLIHVQNSPAPTPSPHTSQWPKKQCQLLKLHPLSFFIYPAFPKETGFFNEYFLQRASLLLTAWSEKTDVFHWYLHRAQERLKHARWIRPPNPPCGALWN